MSESKCSYRIAYEKQKKRVSQAEAERDRLANENTLMQRALSLASHDFSSGNYEALRRHLCDMHARVNVENDFVATLKAHGAAQSTIADLRGQVERLREALAEAIESVEDWAGYASEYFRQKHGLEEELARLHAALGDAS